MDYSPPPNTHHLSDGIVGNVIHQAESRRFVAKNNESSDVSIHAMQMLLQRAAIIPSNHDYEAARAALRERNRENMARYRKMQRDKAAAYEETIQQLREEVQRLELQRQVVASGISTRTTPWNAVAEYFRLFRFGYRPAVPRRATSPARPSAVTQSDYHVQRDFLQATMAKDVRAPACNIEAHLQNWRFISLCFRDFEIRLHRIETVGDSSILATATSTFTMTNDTVRYAFPHLKNEHEHLAAKLVEQKVKTTNAVVFCWDNTIDRVVSIDSDANLMVPLLQMLGNLSDLSLVLNGARLTADYRLAIP